MQDVQTILPTGSVIRDRYVVEDLLGKGGFGAVYLVRDQRVNGNLFALKEVVDPNKEERERFAFECEVLKRLDHPSLTPVYRVFEDDKNSRVYMLMDYIDGPNLETLRQHQPEKRFSPPESLKIMAPIVDAVNYLHSQKPPIIHRDIKPANIIVPEGDRGAVLVDFGIAKEYDQESTTTAIRRCSPGYGAPEQYARGTNLRTDIYGLGATLYAILTGVVPADALYRMTRLGSKSPDPLEPVRDLAPEVPVHVAAAVERAMAINSNDRFASVNEFWQALNAQPVPAAAVFAPLDTTQARPVVTAAPITSTISSTPTVLLYKQPERPRRRLIPALVVLLALIMLIAGVVFGPGLFSRASNAGQRHATAAATPHVTRPPAHPAATPTTKPTVQPTTPPATATPTTPPATATPTLPAATATPVPAGGYPQLNSSYYGTIVDQIGPNYTANMSLTNVVTRGASISGYFSVSNPLQGNGNFTGAVSGRAVNFTVQSYGGHLPLAFNGTIQADNSIAGTYCSVNASGQCDNTQGHGVWHVYLPNSSSSVVPAPGNAPQIAGASSSPTNGAQNGNKSGQNKNAAANGTANAHRKSAVIN